MDPAEKSSTEKAAGSPPRRSWMARYYSPEAASGSLLRPQLRLTRLAAVFVAVIALGYLSTISGLFGFVRYVRHVEGARWVDVLLPSRWAHFRAAKGDAAIRVGAALHQAGRTREAVVYLRAGLAQSPANREGRLLFARLLAEANRPETAQQLLLDGVEIHRDQPDYLFAVFTFLLQRQEDDQTITLAQKLLRTLPANQARNRLAALAGATASYYRGDYDLADDLLHVQSQLATSRDGRLLETKIDWERGYRDLALLQLRALAAEQPNDAEIHGDLVDRLRRVGLRDEARRSSLAFQIAHPGLAGPRMELLRAYADAGDAGSTDREVEALLRDFPRDGPTLLALADFAANAGQVGLSRRLTAQVERQGLPWAPHAFLTVEAMVVAGDYRGALASVRELLRKNADWDQRYTSLLKSLQAVAYLGLGEPETARLLLATFLDQPALRAESLLALANRFAALDAGDQARQILSRAITVDPLNQAALTRLVELDLNLNRIDELPAHLRRLLAMRKPSPEILRVARHKLGSDLFLFSRDRAATLDALHAALEKTRGQALMR